MIVRCRPSRKVRRALINEAVAAVLILGAITAPLFIAILNATNRI